MTTKRHIPNNVRNLFEGLSSVTEHPERFSDPTRYLVFAARQDRLAAAGQGQAFAATTRLDPAVRFTLEAQLEALNAVLDVIDERRPELFRQTERGRDLLDNLQILLNGYTMN